MKGLPGVLVIHGFTATLESVRPLEAPLRALGYEVAMPVLAGHSASSPESLRGSGGLHGSVMLSSFLELASRCDRVFVVGHSMGALLAFDLAATYGDRVAGVVAATPAFRLVSLLAPGRPLHFLAPIIGRWKKTGDSVPPSLIRNFPVPKLITPGRQQMQSFRFSILSRTLRAS